MNLFLRNTECHHIAHASTLAATLLKTPKLFMETLFIPDIIRIDLKDDLGKPLRQKNILLGIQTFANHKNNIDIYPFLSDKDGRFKITKEQVKERANIFISYG